MARPCCWDEILSCLWLYTLDFQDELMIELTEYEKENSISRRGLFCIIYETKTASPH